MIGLNTCKIGSFLFQIKILSPFFGTPYRILKTIFCISICFSINQFKTNSLIFLTLQYLSTFLGFMQNNSSFQSFVLSLFNWNVENQFLLKMYKTVSVSEHSCWLWLSGACVDMRVSGAGPSSGARSVPAPLAMVTRLSLTKDGTFYILKQKFLKTVK